MTTDIQRRKVVRSVFLWVIPAIYFLSVFAMGFHSSSAIAEETIKPFDDMPYSTNIGFSTPMETIAGLTDWAQDINYVYSTTAWICLFVFLAVAIPVCYVIYRFRRKPDQDDVPPKQVHGNAILEFTWTIIPCMLLIIIAIPTWKAIFRQAEPPGPEALIVEVIGHQWWWEFRYPQHNVVTANELHLPENREIFFKISSADVIHSFWIPKLGGKVDAMPGTDHINTMRFTTPTVPEKYRVGGQTFQGQCVELCGLSHALMRFTATVSTKEEFSRWLDAAMTPPVVATAQQRHGEQLFAQCIACHTIAGTPSADLPGKKIGPDLSNFGSRHTLGAGTRINTPENLKLWLDNPPAIKPGSLMPDLNLSKEDIEALSAYLRQSTAKKTF